MEQNLRLVLAIFDTLNRRSLECYGGTYVKTPNFNRLSQKTITFDNHYVGSLPCMPARRELMTGRYNFLHRSWGPLEPFDNALPEILFEDAGVYSHLVTDHSHYWKDGGATYHSRFDSYEFVRGQEMDPWKGLVRPPFEEWEQRYHPSQVDRTPRSKYRRNLVNREYIKKYSDLPSVQTMSLGIEFIETNKNEDNWFLQIETFDPHEPFDVPADFKAGYPTNYSGPILDYPPYGQFSGSSDEIEELKANYAKCVEHCDEQLGRLLDIFDQHNLWKDTALILTTDHGFLLGEHELWAKNVMPVYDEVAKIPFFMHVPGFDKFKGQRRKYHTQTIDLMPTILEIFKIDKPIECQGDQLLKILKADENNNKFLIYGHHGAAINITNGQYTYFLYPENLNDGNLFQYTLMPMHILSMFSTDELKLAKLHEPFNFTKEVPLLKIPVIENSAFYKRHGPGSLIQTNTMLFDLTVDPDQKSPITNLEIETMLKKEIKKLMIESDAPKELFKRFSLEEI